MSATSTILTAELVRYLANHTSPEDEFLRELKIAAGAIGIPAIWISPEQGTFMQVLLRLAGVQRVLEVGTLAGYSAAVMARALPHDGRVDTVEIDAGYADFAQAQFVAAGLSDRISILRGDATEILPGLTAGSYDAAFIDADKDNYPFYLRESLRLVRPGGLIMVDNAFAYGQLLSDAPTKDDVWAIRAFNDLMMQEAGITGLIVPVGDGMWVCLRS